MKDGQQENHRGLYISMAVALVIFGTGFFITQKDTITNFFANAPLKIADKSNTASTTAEEQAVADVFDRDSDQDGLPDWQESLYGSDMHNPDTDGDGTLDGEEVRLQRDPTKANTAKAGQPANDKLATIQDPHFATSSTDITGIKKEFFAKFLQGESQSVQQQAFRDLVKQKLDTKALTPTNQLVDLNITSDNSATALRTYGNAFGVLINKYTAHKERTEAEILDVALKSKKQSDFNELQLPAIAYRNFAADLRALKTPSGLAKSHLLIINGYDGMALGILAMQSLPTNPIQGSGGYQAYTTHRIDVTAGYIQVVKKFRDEGIIFTKDEPGAPFTIQSASSTPVK